jgi:hypothetical protein
MKPSAARKIEMMKASIRCLVYGLLAFLPGIGLPFAAASLVISGRIRRLEKEFWNPASPYRVIGVTCAALATVMWFLVASAMVLTAIKNSCGNC